MVGCPDFRQEVCLIPFLHICKWDHMKKSRKDL
ncbi:unnamed protein product [Callosobruchus maculatus]|uniref:Uncharacterized protein n=1 Tax=Callosobruchus maculatus TaxID=64391 RepID=A0A653DCV0_CALMS|nr:unnamed protein product [Callosobruchus maculatus]